MNLAHPLYEKIARRLAEDFPQTLKQMEQLGLSTDWSFLISPHIVHVAKISYEKIAQSISAIHAVSRRPEYQNSVALKQPWPNNESVLMSYDFHTSLDGRAALIEINTNASGYLVSCLGMAAQSGQSVYELDAIHSLKASFESELKLLKLDTQKPFVAIVDEEIASQKMRVEFLLYKELFEHWGWRSEICESSSLRWNQNSETLHTESGHKIDMVYNRSTDFFLAQDKHLSLLNAWKSFKTAISPQPKEYALLADKSRLLLLQNPDWLAEHGAHAGELTAMQNVILPIRKIADEPDSEELWRNRKKLFFKPQNSYGGKAVYRGESVSRKVFERILTENGLVQEYFPAQKLSEDPQSPLHTWKFDLRCFVYQAQIQTVAARVYQGQVTNFSSREGGFATIEVR